MASGGGLSAVHHLLHCNRRDPAQDRLAERAAEEIPAGTALLIVVPAAAEQATQHPAETASGIVALLLPVLRKLPGHGPRVVIVISIDLAAALLAHPAAQLAPFLAREAAEGFGRGLLV